MADRKVIHLQIDGNDYYFGSVSAIFSVFGKDDIGLGYGALRNYGISPEHPYSNGRVVIKEGVLIAAKGERGKRDTINTDSINAGQYKVLVLDFDMTIFNTAIDREVRKERDWKALYKLIPQYTLYEGWREVLDYCKSNSIKTIIISQAKGEIVRRALKHFNLSCDIVIGSGIWGYPKKTSKNASKLVDIALEQIDCKDIPRNQIISIGDSEIDRDMSQGAGVNFIGAIWDCEKPESLPELQKGKTITKPIQIIDLLKGTDFQN